MISASIAGIGIPLLVKNDLKDQQCITCLEAATKQAPVYPIDFISQALLKLTHTVTTGPIDPPKLAKNMYLAIFMED